jgi:hypothetical protein
MEQSLLHKMNYPQEYQGTFVGGHVEMPDSPWVVDPNFGCVLLKGDSIDIPEETITNEHRL